MPLTSYSQSLRRLESGDATVVRLVEESMASISSTRHLNAYLAVLDRRARERAQAVDRRRAEGRAGELAGMIVAVKDAISLKGQKLTCGSRILEDFVSLYDATAVRRLEEADAVIIGKTNMDEFAMGSSNENSAFGPVLNPVDESRVPGGSSGGSCVAVASGTAHAALGTDTGGSIRQPASFCGIVGLKPTYGRVSRFGLVALSSSFDQIGPFAVTVSDAARVLRVVAGHDPSDGTSAQVAVPDYVAALTGDIAGLRVGLPREAFGEGLQPDVRASVERAVDALRRGGASVTEISLPHSRYTISAYYILMTAEASSNLARYDGARYGRRAAESRDLIDMYTRSRSQGFGAETKRRIMLGTYVLSAGYYDAYYRKAQKVRRLIQQDFFRAFTEADCILLPTSPTTAFTLGEKVGDPLAMYLSDIHTVSANLAGVPAISVPYGKDGEGLPIGIQFIGRQFDESTILRAADYLEKS